MDLKNQQRVLYSKEVNYYTTASKEFRRSRQLKGNYRLLPLISEVCKSKSTFCHIVNGYNLKPYRKMDNQHNGSKR